MKRPLLWGMIALGLSIAFIYYRIPFWGILFFACLLGVIPILFKGIKIGQVIFVLVIYFSGITLGQSAFPLEDALTDFYGQEVRVSGVVSNTPEIEEYGVVLNVTAQEISTNQLAMKSPVGLKVILAGAEGDEKFIPEPGDVLSISGELSRPPGKRNPGGFDYGLYLKSKGIDGLVYVETGRALKIGRDPGPFDGILSLRIRLENLSDAYLSENVSDVLKGVLFGEKDINPDIRLGFQNAGVAHVLSVSGLHVGYVFLLISFFLIKFKVKKKIWLLYLIPSLFFYVALTGFAPSVIRAAIMLGSLTLGQGIHREKDSLNNLCLAGILILCLWPSQLFQPGFQLSMGAVLGIVLFYEPLLFQYKKYYDKRISKKEKKTGPIIEGLALTFCATLGTFPILLYHFKGFTLLSFFSNLLIVPLIGVFLLSGIVFILIILMFPFLASTLAILLSFLGESILVVLTGINVIGEALGFLWIKRGSLNTAEGLLFVFLSFLITGYYHLKIPMVKKSVMLIGCVLGLILIISPLVPGNLVVTFLDVGQGDSILIETPMGLSYLIDGGGYYVEKDIKISERVIIPALYAKNITELTGVFLSHNHVDHSQGIEELLESDFPIDNLFMSVNTNNDTLLNQNEVPVRLLKKGSVVEGPDGVKLEILSPDREVKPLGEDEQNNASLVMRLSYGKTGLLLCGDIEKEIEEKLINEIRQENTEQNIQVIKIPHHGSNTSSTQGFLEWVDPELAVISVGEYNTFGHPRDEVLNRLKNQGIDILRTDRNGAVEITSNGEWIRYKTYGDNQGEN